MRGKNRSKKSLRFESVQPNYSPGGEIIMKFTTKTVSKMTQRDRVEMRDDRARTDKFGRPFCGYYPEVENGYFFWSPDDIAAELFFIDHRKGGYSVKIAGTLATRLRAGMREHPEADQLTLITMENGATSALPSDSVDLSTGFISGSFLHTALVVDVRRLRQRVQRLIEANSQLVGEHDD
jgi:hypothetical protein